MLIRTSFPVAMVEVGRTTDSGSREARGGDSDLGSFAAFRHLSNLIARRETRPAPCGHNRLMETFSC